MGQNSKRTNTSPSSATGRPGRPNGVLLFAGREIREILSPGACLQALEAMYANLHRSPQDKGQALAFDTDDGVIHVKAGLTPGVRDYFAAKVNANYPANAERYGLPTIQGLIVLSECRTGAPVAILQSGVLTGIRTAAASALAIKYGARKDAKLLSVIGCGEQAGYQLEAALGVRPIRQLMAFDTNADRASNFVQWARRTFSIDATVAPDIESAVQASDICITTTTSRSPLVTAGMVPPGCFIAAVGADNPDKQEIDPALFKDARIIVDDIDQCAASGDLAHAIQAGLVSKNDVDATLAGLAAGVMAGRTEERQIVIFDSTGVGIQDVAASAAVYELAVEAGRGHSFEF